MNPPDPQIAGTIAVVIVSWNTRALLENCLASTSPGVSDPEIDVIVVDNASGDGSTEMVRQKFPAAHLIENDENLGFAKANNQGIRASRSEFILLLNADTWLHPGCVRALAGFLHENPGAAAVGPRIANPDGSLQISCYPFPTLFREFWRLFHLDALLPLGSYAMSRWDRDLPREVDILLGACILIRRSALERVGPLNESYFMYSEDLDICYRLRKDGWTIFWHPAAEIVHFGGQSTRQVSRQMFLQLYESKLMFFRLYYGRLSASAYKLILLAAALMRLALSPLASLRRTGDRSRYVELAHNYRQLIRTLLS